MTSCPQCGRIHRADSIKTECTYCGASLQSTMPGSVQWIAIARLANLAEAGYFADWLEGEGIAARVHHRHEFSALSDNWSTSFELQVAPADAKRAVALVREAVDSEIGDDEQLEETPLPRSLRGSLVGGPLLWVFVAGGLAYALGRSGWGATPPPSRPHAVLWRVVADSAPFWSEPRPQKPRRCIRYDEATREIIVEEDSDGDGFMDFRQRFAAVH